ncbi:MAG: hypothetical protein ACP6IU_14845 [Candidatus Asgardarchaeia archaeon]
MSYQEPFIDKFLNEISENDKRVRVLGRIIAKNENYFLLDDGTGNILVFGNSASDVGSIVQVIGKVIKKGKEVGIQAEIIIDFSNINLRLYKQILELKKRIIYA